MYKFLKVAFVVILAVNFLYSQKATITEMRQEFRTYGFFDPNPIARMNNIYPYFRFDGFTNKPVNKEWKIVKLENPYIEVYITPEIGGKIWGALEKSTKNPFVYFNKTVKFRDIAMRGPWTSGGIEFNFGDIGHTPSTSTPVDYMMKENSDGSVSCFVSCLDLPSRTTWLVEVRLEKDKAYFETRSFWYNQTEYNTSLYTWNNGAIDSGDDLELYYPGSNYIDHDGNLYDWPIAKNGKHISKYRENNFGSYKSYHVLGSYTDYFGAYWKDLNFGSGHTSIYEDKHGKKIWIWGLSREGEIWVDLLTDKDLGNRQYVEVQTGMLYNQAVGNKNPFKHSFFEPGSVLNFSEIWFPFKNTGGLSEANENGALNVIRKGEYLVFSFCPLKKTTEELVINSGASIVYRKKLDLTPLETFTDSIKLNNDFDFSVTIGEGLISYASIKTVDKLLSKHKTPNSNFDWNSLYGKYLESVELMRSREYNKAMDKSVEVLKSDPNYLPALVLVAELLYRRAEYQEAADYAKKALQIDIYDYDANYWFGVISKKLKNNYDAKDAFGIASRSMKYKSAAYQNIAEIYFSENNFKRAEEFAKRSIEYNNSNIQSLKLLSVIYRLAGNKDEQFETLGRIEAINPLEHFVRAEKYLSKKNPAQLAEMKKMISCELPQEVFMELALYYNSIGRKSDAFDILKESVTTPITCYWLAYLSFDNEVKRDGYLTKALGMNIEFAFPFRNETFEVLQWAGKTKISWKNDYYTALFLWHKGRIDEAEKLFYSCGNEPLNPSFYLTRANFIKDKYSEKAVSDYKRALELDKNNWRAYHLITGYLNSRAEYGDALVYAKKARTIFKDSHILHFDYAKTLMLNGDYKNALDELEDINILPNEGAREGHDVYRASCLMLAIENIKKNRIREALRLIEKSKEWPENLGAGKPFDFDLRIECLLESVCYTKQNDKIKYRETMSRIAELGKKYENVNNPNQYVSAIVLRDEGSAEKGLKILQDWNGREKTEISEWCLKQYNNNDFIQVDSKSWFVIENNYNFKLVYELLRLNIIK